MRFMATYGFYHSLNNIYRPGSNTIKNIMNMKAQVYDRRSSLKPVNIVSMLNMFSAVSSMIWLCSLACILGSKTVFNQ